MKAFGYLLSFGNMPRNWPHIDKVQSRTYGGEVRINYGTLTL